MCQPCPGPSHPLLSPAKDHFGRLAPGRGTNGLFRDCSPPEGEPRLVSTQDWPVRSFSSFPPSPSPPASESVVCCWEPALSPVSQADGAVCLLTGM